MSKIGKNIKKIRGVKKLSQSVFAEVFGLSRTTVGAYEEGRAEPKIDTILQIAKYFGVSVDALLTKEMTINEVLHFDKFGEPFLKKDKNKSQSIATSTLPIINLDDLDAFYNNNEDKEYLSLLDQFYLTSVDLLGKTVFRLNTNIKDYGLTEGDLLVTTTLKKETTRLILDDKNYFLSEEDVPDKQNYYIENIISVRKVGLVQITDRVKTLESKMDEMMRKFMSE